MTKCKSGWQVRRARRNRARLIKTAATYLGLAASVPVAVGLGLALGQAFAMPHAAKPVSTYAEIVATTFDGNTYVAGSGDDCAAAWEGRVMPADTFEVICILTTR